MRNRSFIFEIDRYLVSSDILTEFFACDYETCKGCCCIIGDSGAPVEEDEIEKLEDNYPLYKPFMTSSGIAVIEKNGVAEIDTDGDLVTPLVGKMECAYTCFDENENCFCAIEKSYCAGRSRFKKPISCSLYPIRLSQLSNGYTALNLHRWDICKCAFEKGKKERLPVYKFLREVITSHFGEEFYSALEEAAKSLQASS